jgi:hypothetical protein
MINVKERQPEIKLKLEKFKKILNYSDAGRQQDTKNWFFLSLTHDSD